ncbi:flagellar basal body-associated FliL family protein [Treponema sp. OMZ 840]|uniref:flagellar basal body-associated FliL family protein n=1 Tax=Treponema sp. OMZ 840 TaxID=244313 RepID=UPI003D945D2F
MNKIQRICLFCSAILLSVLIFGTAAAFVSGKAKPGTDLRRKDPEPQVFEKKIQADKAVFSHIGSLRCATADNPPIPLVITVYFPYTAADKAFYEELSQKTRKIRFVITNYMEQYTRTELSDKGEQKLKADLTDLINRELVLGKITELYFSDYIFLE